ncbi:MAG: NAD(P)/FAD-dependent oxidoreductase [Robiginitomaculum sp.]|nr:NAD(P)/FAD-dependent oxidoreductase [Robiginitomaculum sp.]
MTTASQSAIKIVGAGPAGLASAIVLARAGRKVEVHDRRKRPGGRFHNDFQGLENWSSRGNILEELSQAGIEASFDHTPVRTGLAFDSWGKAYAINSDEPLYYLLRRGDAAGSLDRGLLSQAQDLGVIVKFGSHIKEEKGPAILAIGPRTADVIAVGYIFETDRPDGNWICFDDKLAPLGYAYLLISSGKGTVATCMFTKFKEQNFFLKKTIEFFEARADLTMKNPKPMGGYGNFRLPRTAMQGNKLVIGEQAGFQDSLAGFGMTYAIRSGILAARSLLESLDYTKLWKKELLPLLQTSIANRYLFNLAGPWGRRIALSRIARSEARKTLQQLYRPWWLSRLVRPLAVNRYKVPLKDKSCDHQNCQCVWCVHGLAHT